MITFVLFLQISIGVVYGCTININTDLNYSQPLLLNPNNSDEYGVFFPRDTGDEIKLLNGEVVKIVCPDGNIVVGDDLELSSFEIAACENNKLKINGGEVDFVNVTCTNKSSDGAEKNGKTFSISDEESEEKSSISDEESEETSTSDEESEETSTSDEETEEISISDEETEETSISDEETEETSTSDEETEETPSTCENNKLKRNGENAPCSIPTPTHCIININDFNKKACKPSPLLLHENFKEETNPFVLPETGKKIIVKEGEKVKVACPGGEVRLGDESPLNHIEEITCERNKLKRNGEIRSFADITCTAKFPRIIKSTGRSCLDSYKVIEIGYEVEGKFLKHIEVCFDKSKDNVIYSKFTLVKQITKSPSDFPQSTWEEGLSFSDSTCSKVDNLYEQNEQKITFNQKLLGLSKNSRKYINSEFHLTRGHLTAKSDFFYGAQQDLTFSFENAAPQWNTFNDGNWKSLEKDIRKLASAIYKDLTVFTGTYDVATLPHEGTGSETELFLYVNGDDKRIPVPRLFWKIVYHEDTKAGIVFLGVNNPHVRITYEKDIICKNICYRNSGLRWDRTDKHKGYSYCCTYKNLKEKINENSGNSNEKPVDTFPTLQVDRLLTLGCKYSLESNVILVNPTNRNIVSPQDENNKIRLLNGEILEVECPEGYVVMIDGEQKPSKTYKKACRNNIFSIKDDLIHVTKIECIAASHNTARATGKHV